MPLHHKDKVAFSFKEGFSSLHPLAHYRSYQGRFEWWLSLNVLMLRLSMQYLHQTFLIHWQMNALQHGKKEVV